MSRVSHEQAEFDRLHFPDGRTLRNKLGISDFKALEASERSLAERRAMQGLPDSARELSYDGYKSIHRHLFQDIYSWAGEERTYTSRKGETTFTRAKMIPSYMEGIFKELKKENYLEGLSKDKFAERAAYYVNNINAGHPFNDGNGRTQRTWLRQLADRAGYELKLGSCDKNEWHSASIVGFHQSDKPMADLIVANLRERVKSQSQEKTSLQRKAARAAKNYREQAEPDKNPERER